MFNAGSARRIGLILVIASPFVIFLSLLGPAPRRAYADFTITNCPGAYSDACGCIQRTAGYVDCSNKYGGSSGGGGYENSGGSGGLIGAVLSTLFDMIGNFFSSLFSSGSPASPGASGPQPSPQQVAQQEQQRRLAELQRLENESVDIQRQIDSLRAKEFQLQRQGLVETLIKVPGDAFFNPNAKPVEIKFTKLPSGQKVTLASQWARLYCSLGVSWQAAGAAASGDLEGAKYLGYEAELAMSAGQVDVDCPSAPSPPVPYGQVGTETPVDRVYARLVTVTSDSLQHLVSTQQHVVALTDKKAQGDKQVQDLTQTVNQKQREVQQAEQGGGNPPDVQAKKSALAEALAALQQAKQAQADVDKDLQKATQEREAELKQLNRYKEIYQQVGDHPDAAPKLLKELDQTP